MAPIAGSDAYQACLEVGLTLLNPFTGCPTLPGGSHDKLIGLKAVKEHSYMMKRGLSDASWFRYPLPISLT